ncbi:MAG: hypothetical protein E7564_00975 [Ruminococcaceae bacterium]|nr:hypothetical protein [Oscillospiraceae bacterium]
MSNVGSKISCGGLLICALTAGIRILTYFGAIVFGDEVIADTYIYLNYGFLIGLAIAFIGYLLKFIGERDFFDLITAVTILITLVVSSGLFPYVVFGAQLSIGKLIYSVLEELFLLGLGLNFMKKGKSAPGIIMILIFVYFAFLYPVAIAIIFGGGVGGILNYLINIFNGVIITLNLGLAAVTAVNSD